LFFWKGGTVQIFGNGLDKSEFLSAKNYEQIELWECFLSFSAESFVFQFAIQRCKD
jgi:hypothetical protein